MTTFREGRVFENDADAHPFAQDLAGVWHRRPAGDPWIASIESPNCRTVCGQAIHSVHISDHEPEPDEHTGSTLCRCVAAPSCDHCGEPITGTPVTSEDDPLHRVFCKSDCRDDEATGWE